MEVLALIRVKDTERLKAFGYETMNNREAKNVGHAFISFGKESGDICVTGNACVELAEELFDLQAAGLLERVSENGQSD